MTVFERVVEQKEDNSHTAHFIIIFFLRNNLCLIPLVMQ